jgi:hypothetical protein
MVCLVEIGGGSDPRPLLVLSAVYPPLWPLTNQPIPSLVGTPHTDPTNDFPGDLGHDVNGSLLKNLRRRSYYQLDVIYIKRPIMQS